MALKGARLGNAVLSGNFANQAIFLVTGIFQTLVIQAIVVNGGADTWTLLTVLAQYIGTSLACLVPIQTGNVVKPVKGVPFLSEDRDKRQDIRRNVWFPYAAVLLSSTLDVFGNILTVLSIVSAGSGLFQVIFSAVAVFVALLSHFTMRRYLSQRQWAAVVLVTAGLLCSAMGRLSTGMISSSLQGIMLSFATTLVYALFYVWNEYVLSSPTSPTGKRFSMWLGLCGAVSMSLYVVTYTVPRWSELVVDRIAEAGGSPSWVLLMYGTYVGASALHSATYYALLESCGAVSTGILQSLRAVSVFGLSAYLFCDINPAQCYNQYKGFGTVLVCLGVVAYSMSKAATVAALPGPLPQVRTAQSVKISL